MFTSETNKIKMNFNEEDKESGVIYIITETDSKSVQECIFSASSLKKYSPELPVAVFFNGEQDFPKDYFDYVIPIQMDVQYFQAKVELLYKSPFKKTLFLDSNTEILQPISQLFTELKEYDICAAKNPQLSQDKPQKLLAYENEESYSTALLLYRKSDETEIFFNTWVQRMIAFSKSESSYDNNVVIKDQPFFNQLISQKFCDKHGIRIKTLPNTIYLVRFNMIKNMIIDGKLAEIKILNNSIACLDQMARQYEAQKDYTSAIDCLEKLVELHPNPSSFQYNLNRLILKHKAGAGSEDYLKPGDFGAPQAESDRLRAQVEQLQSLGEPIYLQFGSGDTPFVNFLNIDLTLGRNRISRQMYDRIFLYPWLDKSLPIPDNSVDFIFHQDMFEHLSQMQQFLLLAEARRILKPSCFHRINMPCIADSMKSSEFEKGYEGVYTQEWTKCGHVNVLTRGMLEEMSRIVGYSNIIFNSKGGSVSGVQFTELRPGPDRHQLTGNIFADLMK